jgi:hypothetical protein
MFYALNNVYFYIFAKKNTLPSRRWYWFGKYAKITKKASTFVNLAKNYDTKIIMIKNFYFSIPKYYFFKLLVKFKD